VFHKIVLLFRFTRFTRSRIAGLACDYDIAGCKESAVELFSQWMANPENNP